MYRVPLTRTRPILDALGSIGLGLLTGGVLLALVAVFRLGAMGNDALETVTELPSWWVTVALGTLAALITPRWGEEQAGTQSKGHQRWAHTLLFAVVGMSSLYVSYAAFPANTFWATATSSEAYSPAPIRVSVWGAAVVIFLGAALTAASTRRPRVRAPLRFLPLFSAGLVLVIAAEFVLRASALYEPVDYVIGTVAPEDDGLEVPTEANKVGWSWTAPTGARLESVQSGPSGPLLIFEDGIVALDGTTGDELWHYRKPYSDIVEVSVIHDGATGVVASLPNGQPSGDQTITEISTTTGEITRESTLGGWVSDAAPEDAGFDFKGRTSDMRLFLGSEDGNSLRWSARSAETGEELWRFKLPSSDGRTCAPDDLWAADRNYVLAESRVVFLYGCLNVDPDTDAWRRNPWNQFDRQEGEFTLEVVAKDADTGRTAWKHTWEGSQGSPMNIFRLAASDPAPSREGDPVITLGSLTAPPVILDPKDGTPITELPGDLAEFTAHDRSFERLVYSDSEFTIIQTGSVFDRELSEVFQLEPHTGSAIETIRASSDSLFFRELETANLLGDSISIMSRHRGSIGDSRALSFATLPFGSDVTDVDWIELGPVHPDTRRATGVWEDRAQMVPVPGAVVAYVTETEPMVVYGLVA